MNELPDELITNHVIPHLKIYQKLQFGLVCNKFYEFVKKDLQKEVKRLKELARQKALACEIFQIHGYYDHPLSGYAKTSDGKIVLFEIAHAEATEYLSEQYPDYFREIIKDIQDEDGDIWLNGTWWTFAVKPDVSKLPAELFQSKNGSWNGVFFFQNEWNVSSYCIFNLFLVPDDWNDYSTWPDKNILYDEWEYLDRRSETYFTRTPDCKK